MDFKIHLIKDIESIRALGDSLVDGWVPDPVLMPSGRPNVVEGLGAVYHLVKGDDDDIAFYIIKASPELNLAYAKEKMAESKPKEAGEFAGDDLSLSLPHGQVPSEAGGWRIFKVYEKSVIWIRHGEKTKA